MTSGQEVKNAKREVNTLQQDQKSFSDLKYKEIREREQPFKIKLLEVLLSGEKGRVLDVGCGTGLISEIIEGNYLSCFGVDVSLEAIKKYNLNGLVGVVSDLEHLLPYGDDSFDVIWASEVIEHVKNCGQLFSEMRRILRPGGKLYLTTPNSAFFIYRFFYFLGKTPAQLQHPCHVNFFTFADITEVLKNKGFISERVFGQNVYGFIPAHIIKRLSGGSKKVEQALERALSVFGFRRTQGLIHGDKFMLYSFSKKLYSFFSNTILVIARKPSH